MSPTVKSKAKVVLACALASFCSKESTAPTTSRVNQSPVISAVTVVPGSMSLGQQARITVTATDPDGDALQVSYASQLGNPIVASGLAATYTAQRTGTDLIVVTVVDASGGRDVRNATTTVAADPAGPGRAPRLSLKPPANNGTIVLGQGGTVEVDICAENPSSASVSWGDGSASSGCSASHTYPAAGFFQMVVRASGVEVSSDVRATADYTETFYVSVIPPGGPVPTTTTLTPTTTTTPASTTTSTTTTTTSTTTTTTTTSTLSVMLDPFREIH